MGKIIEENVDTNKKVIRDRGWGPLKKNLLQHPEISCSKPSFFTRQNFRNLESNDCTNVQDLTPSSSQDTSSKVEIEIINFNSGYAGQVIQTILKKLSEANNHYGI